MNGRSATALLAVLSMTALGLAGCIAPNDFLGANSTKAEISAMEDKDLADNAAKAWNPDAQLVGVFGLEQSAAAAERNGGNSSDVPVDPNVGNGKAPAWIYGYTTGNDTRAFRVTADGRVRVENSSSETMGMAEEVKPIVDWKIDSDKAFATAKANETFATALAEDNVSIAEGVGRDTNATILFFDVVGKGGMVWATVDATSGKLLDVHGFTMDLNMRMPSSPYWNPGAGLHENGTGRVDASKPMQEFPFSYAGSPTSATFSLKLNRDLPTDSVSWKIVDASGQTLKSGTGSSMNPAMGSSDSVNAKVQVPGGGSYKVVVAYRAPGMTPVPLGGVSFTWTLASDSSMPGM